VSCAEGTRIGKVEVPRHDPGQADMSCIPVQVTAVNDKGKKGQRLFPDGGQREGVIFSVTRCRYLSEDTVQGTMSPFLVRAQPFMYNQHPFFGLVLMLGIWIVQLIIGYLIFRDAQDKKMAAPLWTILAIIPVFGYFAAVLYLIIRELLQPKGTGKLPIDILKERFARGEISSEEFEKGKSVLQT
jgi:putative membrane protein